jgi:hypothetical protein
MTELQIAPILPITLQQQEIPFPESRFLQKIPVTGTFNTLEDFVEGHLYSIDQTYLQPIVTSYRVTEGLTTGTETSVLDLDPQTDLVNNGILQGTYNVVYNFLKRLSANSPYKILELSTDRTELRTRPVNPNPVEQRLVTDTLRALVDPERTFQGFYLNFGQDILLLGINVEAVGEDTLLKLPAPLPDFITLDSIFNLNSKISEPVAYTAEYLIEELQIANPVNYLRGPNLNVKESKSTNTSTQPVTLTNLLQALSSSYVDQLTALTGTNKVNLNIDHTEYQNFTYFSSAQQRLANFYSKISEIEYNQNQVDILKTLTLTPEVSASIQTYTRNISQIIEKFDSYDYYLYFDSGSKTWPKSTSTKPYQLYSTASVEGQTWYLQQTTSASLYDAENDNYLYNTFPTYITEDNENLGFQIFINMVAQMFDQVWVYTKAIEDIKDTDNRVENGISIELVRDRLESLGVNIYESNISNYSPYISLLGINQDGSTQFATGSEYIQTYVTASAESIPLDTFQKSIYKRIYHNLPGLLKKKGTLDSVRILLNCFGIPETVVTPVLYGGATNQDSRWQYYGESFGYSLDTKGTSFVQTAFTLNSAWNATSSKPQSVQVRFKTPGIPNINQYTQTLWATDTGILLTLSYTASNLQTGSYSGSTLNPDRYNGTLTLYPTASDLQVSASITLPLFNKEWWAIQVDKHTANTFTLQVANKSEVLKQKPTPEYQGLSTVTGSNRWDAATESKFGSGSYGGANFSGSLQEIRYYTIPGTTQGFLDFAVNSTDTYGDINTENLLAFRGTLGNLLFTQSRSVHPKITGSLRPTASFATGSDFTVTGTYAFTTTYEYRYYKTPGNSLLVPKSYQITEGSATLPGTGSINIPNNKVLSRYTTVQQGTEEFGSTTLELGLSPQDSINKDILTTVNLETLGNLIGDPREVTDTNTRYNTLQEISREYFDKYTGPSNWRELIRLTQYFDNASFRSAQDYIPAKISTRTGFTLKQHILERNKHSGTVITVEDKDLYAQVESENTEQTVGIQATPGGCIDVNDVQTAVETLQTVIGPAQKTYQPQTQLLSGEYSGSEVNTYTSQDNPLLGKNQTLNTRSPEYREFLPLLNNADSNRRSSIFRKVDYNTNLYSPSNQQQILSQSAEFASVEDSDYATHSRWSKIRYAGSKNTGKINTGSILSNTSINSGMPIDQFTDYFAYFDWIGGSDPQYPGGGNIHIIRLIQADGTVQALTPRNENLHIVENIFKTGTPLGMYFLTGSTNTIEYYQDTYVVEGGALYETILLASGSASAAKGGFSTDAGTTTTAFRLCFLTSSVNSIILTETSSVTYSTGSLYVLMKGIGPVNSDSTQTASLYSLRPGLDDNFVIFNKTDGTFVRDSGNVKYSDTYLPLQYGDFIRFGNTQDPSFTNTSSLDATFEGAGLYQIKQINTGSSLLQTSSIELGIPIQAKSFGVIKSGSLSEQNYRIFRRIPYENFVVVNKIPRNRGAGLLIPYNFNPRYNPIEIAKKAGIL